MYGHEVCHPGFDSHIKDKDLTKQAQRAARREASRLRSEERRKERELRKKEGCAGTSEFLGGR